MIIVRDDQRERLPMPSVGDHVYWDDYRTETHESLKDAVPDSENLIWLSRNAIVGYKLASGEFAPMGNMVLVGRNRPAVAEGSIFIPDAAQQRRNHGTVRAIGRWKDDDEPPYAVGERVCWNTQGEGPVRESLQAFALEDEELVLLNRADPMCVVTDV